MEASITLRKFILLKCKSDRKNMNRHFWNKKRKKKLIISVICKNQIPKYFTDLLIFKDNYNFDLKHFFFFSSLDRTRNPSISFYFRNLPSPPPLSSTILVVKFSRKHLSYPATGWNNVQARAVRPGRGKQSVQTLLISRTHNHLTR